jgi:uncharacterized membrane protein YdbT with pleckstrin-like domain
MKVKRMLVLFCLFVSVTVFFEYMGYEFDVTNKRIIVKMGLIATKAREIFLNRAESRYSNQLQAGCWGTAR